ncbi:hypothetical protein VTK56DRAFT_2668 [Thermocarpiscus australiensis]
MLDGYWLRSDRNSERNDIDSDDPWTAHTTVMKAQNLVAPDRKSDYARMDIAPGLLGTYQVRYVITPQDRTVSSQRSPQESMEAVRTAFEAIASVMEVKSLPGRYHYLLIPFHQAPYGSHSTLLLKN